MTPQELKNSVLQLAIQGRLVEQRPEEGTAGELFAQIQEEKQRLVQEGKIKANKKIEPISDDTIPFDIPDSWVWIRFGNLVNYSMGKTPPRAESEWWGGDSLGFYCRYAGKRAPSRNQRKRNPNSI